MLPPLTNGPRNLPLPRNTPYQHRLVCCALPREDFGFKGTLGGAMRKIKSTSPYLSPTGDSTNDSEKCSEEVLEIYTAAVKFSLEEHQATFDAAFSAIATAYIVRSAVSP